ncbi:MAG TPA: malto-oligosyltrehalose trehalohydrolase [Steroidobacteraceae bacterium]|nr:malto-oligosyltrehalose trehalohydrolase [Steroidobacteraceae bacterium]
MSTRRRHSMAFGAELTETGAVRFRLWAPAARAVELLLHDSSATPRSLEMSARPEGWFELVTRDAHAGTLYRYRIDGKLEVPDPASRSNPGDIHGPSQVIDPMAFVWDDAEWRGRPWHEAVIYELHVGCFSPEGTFAGVQNKLDHLVELGVTVIELMPIADFPGKRGWGYDGVLPFAPESAYGRPEDLKALVAAAHKRGLAVMLDVVYNHFGPEGNYLHVYAPQFFTNKHHTPWGSAINFDSQGARTVRDFYTHNALYWLEEYNLDGLRFDAVHAIRDDSNTHILTEIAAAARAGPGRERPRYLVLENGANQAHFLGEPGAKDTFDAQWNDDLHHCLHTILTGETDGYYEDYVDNPNAMLCRCLAEGFAYQGQYSPHLDAVRGEPSAHLPPTAFMSFLQNHDQIGNRALGERLHTIARSAQALRAAHAIVLLAPAPPLLFMGEEWEAPQPFPYFCDFEPALAAKVREGRKREFARFAKFGGAAGRAIPDPTAAETFQSAHLDWSVVRRRHPADVLDQFQRLLAIRRRDIVPLIPRIRSGTCTKLEPSGAFAVDWEVSDGAMLHLLANLTDHPVPVVGRVAGRMIFATHPSIRAAMTRNELAPWSVTWLLERGVDGA